MGSRGGHLCRESQSSVHRATRRIAGPEAAGEHALVVVDASGRISEDWTKWDSFFERLHAVYINPYDAEKNVWVVDDYKEAFFKFSQDGKQLLQTIGTIDQSRADDKHFNRPTFLTWLPDSTMFVSDGYNGTRIAKFDTSGKFLLAWGEKGIAPNELRPGYLNVVHGITADPVTHRAYVVDRSNHRMQGFDENGKFVDQEGNVYAAEVGNGRAQKFRPRQGANPALLVGRPVYAAWK